MTLIVRHKGRIILMCKGADSIMLPRLKQEPKTQRQIISVQRELLAFAKEGLRTLVVCQKEMDAQSYQKLDNKIYEI